MPLARDSHSTKGLSLALTANLTWAVQVLYWPLLAPSTAPELLAHRIVWSAVACLILVLVVGRYRELVAIVRQPRALLLLAGAAACLTATWGVYIYAVTSAHVVESSLGLFLIPLTTAVVGVVIFAEKLRFWQWIAVAGAALATLLLTIDYGRLPWIALTISTLMAGYALLKKQSNVAALPGLTVECLLALGPAVAFLGWFGATGRTTVGQLGWDHTMLVAASVLITAIPLLAHAAAINLLPLSTVGILQYLNPTIQFAIGVFIFHEVVPATRWAGFILIWCALLIFILDSFYASRGRRPAPRPVPRPRRGPVAAARGAEAGVISS